MAAPRIPLLVVVVGVGLYAGAIVALTWPVFRQPATTVLDAVSLYGPAGADLVQRDINLTMWTLAWVSRALVTDPLHLFDANVFYPARYTLACTEHMLGNVPFFGPVFLLTDNPVLAHQVTLVASFVVAGLGMAAYVFYWTADRASALAAGFFFAFAEPKAISHPNHSSMRSIAHWRWNDRF